MPPVRMIDLIEHAARFHRELAVRYETSSGVVEDEKARVFLRFVGRHEAALARAMEDYEAGASRSTLESYFETAPDFSRLLDADAIAVTPETTFDEARDLALQLDEALISVYEACEREAASGQLREAIHALLEMEKTEEIRLMRATLTG